MPLPILLLLLGVLSTSLCSAQTRGERLTSPTSPQDSTIHIPEVQIVDRKKKAVFASPRLAGKELEKLNTHAVADALRYFSGLQLKDYGGVGGFKTINLQSMGSQQLAVSYDGIPLGNTMNGQIDLARYALDNMRSINLICGLNSNLFLSASEIGSASTISIETRHPQFAPGAMSNIFATLRAGSFSLLNPYIRVEEKISQNIAATLNTEWHHSSGKYPFKMQTRLPDGKPGAIIKGVRQHADIQVLRLEGAVFGKLPLATYHLRVYHTNSSRGIPGPIVNNVLYREEILGDRDTFVQSVVKAHPSRRYSLRIAAKYAHYYTRYAAKDPRYLPVDQSYYQNEIYASTTHLIQMHPGLTGVVAYDMQYNTLDIQNLETSMPQISYPSRAHLTHKIATTIRTDYWGVLLQASLVGSILQRTKNRSTNLPSRSALTPSIAASYSPRNRPGLQIRSYAKATHRFPNLNDLYYTGAGRTLLKGEYGIQYNLGLTWQSQAKALLPISYQCAVDVYHSQIDNKIVASPTGQQFHWSMQNLGKVETDGLDTQLQLKMPIGLSAQFSTKLQYSLQHATDRTSSKDSYYKHQIPYVPLHAGSTTSSLAFYGAEIRYSFLYTGTRYAMSENSREYRLPPWQTHDLTLSYAHNLWGANFRIALEINNLLGKDYQLIPGYPMPRRNYKAILQVEI